MEKINLKTILFETFEGDIGKKFTNYNGEEFLIVRSLAGYDLPSDYTGIVKDLQGNKAWIKNGKFYRDDEPTIIMHNGEKRWVNSDGNYHREGDEPASINPNDGSMFFFKNGKLHRENNLPAVIKPGMNKYYVEDELHRTNGPAIQFANKLDGRNQWFLFGKRYDDRKSWQKAISKLNKKIKNPNSVEFAEISESTNQDQEEIIKFNDFDEVPKNFTGIAEYPNGSKLWYLNGKLHREDGPAVEDPDRHKEWWLNGELHREDDLPAIEFADGSKHWYLNGKLHREDGPAVETKFWKHWYLNGKLHREDGPAIEYLNGDKSWCLNNKFNC